MYEFWSKYHLPIGNSNLPKNRSETSYLLNKLDVLFEMPVYDTIAGGGDGDSSSCSVHADNNNMNFIHLTHLVMQLEQGTCPKMDQKLDKNRTFFF